MLDVYSRLSASSHSSGDLLESWFIQEKEIGFTDPQRKAPLSGRSSAISRRIRKPDGCRSERSVLYLESCSRPRVSAMMEQLLIAAVQTV